MRPRVVHTFFMSMPIDCVMVDKENRIVAVKRGVGAGCWFMTKGIEAILELGEGEAAQADLKVGTVLGLEPLRNREFLRADLV